MVLVNALRQWCSRSCGHINSLISSLLFWLNRFFLKRINFSQTHQVHGSLILESFKFRSENESEDEYKNEFKGGCHHGNLCLARCGAY